MTLPKTPQPEKKINLPPDDYPKEVEIGAW